MCKLNAVNKCAFIETYSLSLPQRNLCLYLVSRIILIQEVCGWGINCRSVSGV